MGVAVNFSNYWNLLSLGIGIEELYLLKVLKPTIERIKVHMDLFRTIKRAGKTNYILIFINTKNIIKPPQVVNGLGRNSERRSGRCPQVYSAEDHNGKSIGVGQV